MTAKMSEGENLYRPLYTVIIRRGNKVAKGIPTKMLVPYIEGKKLLRTDEISGDGIRWTRLDQHFQLARYFKDETSPKVLRDAPSPFPQEDDADPALETLYPLDEDCNPSSPPQSAELENRLSDLAEMLKDLNQ